MRPSRKPGNTGAVHPRIRIARPDHHAGDTGLGECIGGRRGAAQWQHGSSVTYTVAPRRGTGDIECCGFSVWAAAGRGDGASNTRPC